MDAVSDRDFILDVLYAASMVTMHLSQFCEELIFGHRLWLGLLPLAMNLQPAVRLCPKKNPDIAEPFVDRLGL